MNPIRILEYIAEFERVSTFCEQRQPWDICAQLKDLLPAIFAELGEEYVRNGSVVVHRSAVIEQGVIFKGPVIIGENSRVSAYSYFREGVWLGDNVHIGPSCEIKASLIFSQSAIAHFNYVGNSLLGSHVNLEAGVVLANHFNERTCKEIAVCIDGVGQHTGATKFGALIGDDTKIGANAVTTPGTILNKHSIIERGILVKQLRESEPANIKLNGCAIHKQHSQLYHPDHIDNRCFQDSNRERNPFTRIVTCQSSFLKTPPKTHTIKNVHQFNSFYDFRSLVTEKSLNTQNVDISFPKI